MKRISISIVSLFIAFFFCGSFTMAASYNPEIYQAQKALKELGYNPGKPDGIWGNKTKKAVERFQSDNGLPVTGKLDRQTKNRLGLPRTGQKQTIAKSSSSGTRGIKLIAKPAKGQSQQIQLYDYTAALIIGIDRYANLGPGDQLSYAVKDARGMEKVLRENFQFDEIVTLYNEQATRDKIMRVLYGFRSLSPDAGVLVYFAGHGITISGILRGKDLGYIVPFDGS